ncbi:MAG: asparagine synthase (glutamine-hydrolysing) [Parcubacteria group bacterium LiPW_15]|nr:MAG: asparagine synthase (glutamine-hydrolysing) [Parcubacteria group bacterium LiPW_15]
MCGIAGAISFSAGQGSEDAVRKMNARQKLRGPDDEGLNLFGHAALGQRRLSIIDLSSDGHQPMSLGGLHITFNGEIYNFEEIKKELVLRGHAFKTKTDTEVILAAYKEWGKESFSRLRGMFALALYDSEKEELILARDRYGIKPLYYAKIGEGLVFASTVAAIKESGLVEPNEDEEAKIGFLLFGSVPLPKTTFKEIRAVRAGHYLSFSKNGTEEVKYYDSLAPFLNKISPTKKEAVSRLRELLEESVRLHLISDAPLGVFLSGGIDSSVLAILAAGQRKEPLDTLSIDFKEQKFSEKRYREGVVAQIKSRHKEYLVGKEDFGAEKENILAAMDQPTIDGVNTYFVSRAAKEAGLKVVLSGLGSDEIFMGYHYFGRAALFRFLQKLPLAFKWPLKIFSRRNGWAKLIYLYRGRGLMNFYLSLRGLFSPAEIAEILKINESSVWDYVAKLEDSLPAKLASLHPADALSWLEVNFYMANQLLKDTDFMSMRHSIEARVPFLDHVLVEYLSSLPVSLKLSSRPKELLISAMEEELPREVWDRPKMGFTFPMAEWLGVGRWAKAWAQIISATFYKKNEKP